MSSDSWNRIVVPVGLSDRCADAVAWARTHVAEGGQVHAVHVLADIPAYAPGMAWGGIDEEKRRTHADRTLREWLAANDAEDVVLHLRMGSVARGILEAVEAIDADLLVMAARRSEDVGVFRLGTVTERVVRAAACDVFVRKRTG